MAFAYCRRCGHIIGEFYSILEGKRIEALGARHKPHCPQAGPPLDTTTDTFCPICKTLPRNPLNPR